MIIYVVVICCVLVIYVLRRYQGGKPRSTTSKKIPLEKGLPIIGVMNNIKEPLFTYLFKLSHKYGPIYQFRYGMRNIVVLNTFEYIKAALVDNGDPLSGRWKAENHVFVTNNAGLFFIDGKVWAEQRSFVLKTLRDFGVGRSRSLEIVQDECAHMLRDLEPIKGQKFILTHFLSIYMVNVISKFVMNKRFSLGNPEFQVLEKYMAVLATKKDPIAIFLLMFPIIENFEWLMKFIMWITSRKALADEYHNLLEKEVKEHLSKLNFNSEGDDLIDRFLIKQRRVKENTGNVGTFTDWQLVRNVFDLLLAGIDTSSISLTWGFMFMAMYQEVQTKVYEEIIDKIGHQRMAKMSDKVSLVYTQAVMDEIWRLSSIVPLSDRHRVLKDVNVKGYFIPMDTIVVPNLFASQLDPNIWEKPLEFYPEHFLQTDSNGDVRYHPREEMLAFGLGKRQCLGESLARMEYFIFFVSLLQRFHVNLAKEKSHFDVFSGSDGIIRKPDEEEFIFRERLES